MKKFEIVNNTWIKQLKFKDSGNNYTKSQFSALKIDCITYWYTTVFDVGSGINHHISLSGNFGIAIDLHYKADEAKEYQEDLLFFTNLLFKN